MLSEYRTAEGDGWSYTLDELGRCFERHATSRVEPLPDSGETLGRLFRCCDLPLTEACRDLFGAYLLSMNELGRRTAQLHAALATVSGEPELVAQPLSELYQRSLYQSIRSWVRRSADLLTKNLDLLPDPSRKPARRIIDSQELLLEGVRRDLNRKLDGCRIRCHGNYELQHVLFTGDDFLITDFGGKAGRPASEMRIKASPVRDIASMICSLLAAGHAALRGKAPSILVVPEQQTDAERLTHHWFACSTQAFLDSYRSLIKDVNVIPADNRDLAGLLRVHLVEHLCIKLLDSLTADPDQVSVFVDGLKMLIDCWAGLQERGDSDQ
jgi:maltose alpha-D-glucosyltransferase/alpha-amylase